jgi:hypothetical protein
MLRVIIKNVGQDAYITEIDDSLKAMQAIVGGHIEVVPVGSGMTMVCNEEGKIFGLHPNFATDSDVIVGNVFFARLDAESDGEFKNITQQDFDILVDYLKNRAGFVFNDYDNQDEEV